MSFTFGTHINERQFFAKNNLQAHKIVTSSKVFLEKKCQTHKD